MLEETHPDIRGQAFASAELFPLVHLATRVRIDASRECGERGKLHFTKVSRLSAFDASEVFCSTEYLLIIVLDTAETACHKPKVSILR